MVENQLILNKSQFADANTLDHQQSEDFTRKDPLILCALVVIGLIGFLYVLHCLNRNDFSPKYIQQSSFELSDNYTPSTQDAKVIASKN